MLHGRRTAAFLIYREPCCKPAPKFPSFIIQFGLLSIGLTSLKLEFAKRWESCKVAWQQCSHCEIWTCKYSIIVFCSFNLDALSMTFQDCRFESYQKQRFWREEYVAKRQQCGEKRVQIPLGHGTRHYFFINVFAPKKRCHLFCFSTVGCSRAYMTVLLWI